jgi:hypothetical protein
MQCDSSTQHVTDDTARAKSLKKHYNKSYYKRKNGRKSSHQPQQNIPDASEVLPDHLIALARSSSPSFRESREDLSEPDRCQDRFGTYMTALRRYFSLKEQLNQHPMGQAGREQRDLLRRMARDVVDAYEKMRRG